MLTHGIKWNVWYLIISVICVVSLYPISMTHRLLNHRFDRFLGGFKLHLKQRLPVTTAGNVSVQDHGGSQPGEPREAICRWFGRKQFWWLWSRAFGGSLEPRSFAFRGTFPPFNLSEGLGFDCKVAQHEMLVGVFTAPKEEKFWRRKKGSRGFGGYWKVPGWRSIGRFLGSGCIFPEIIGIFRP